MGPWFLFDANFELTPLEPGPAASSWRGLRWRPRPGGGTLRGRLTLRLRTIQVCSKDAGNNKPGVRRLGVEGMGRSYRPTAFVPTRDALRHGLQNLGYSEGRNITLDVCYTQGRSDLAAQFAAELVRSDVAVIVPFYASGEREALGDAHE